MIDLLGPVPKYNSCSKTRKNVACFLKSNPIISVVDADNQVKIDNQCHTDDNKEPTCVILASMSLEL